MRFSIGDLVVEKTINHWYFTTYGYNFSMSPYYSDGYWEEYYDKAKQREPYIGLIIDIKDTEPPLATYDTDINYRTYKVMWLNVQDDDYMMHRYFFGDELRLISKINHAQEKEADE